VERHADRNARGIDAIIYSQDGTRTYTLQIKALSKRNPVPLGTHLDALFAQFFIVCRNVAKETPECFVLTPAEVRSLVHRGEKDGRYSYWLQPRSYEADKYREAWQRIGNGAALEVLPSTV
jgi:hypothetical protein